MGGRVARRVGAERRHRPTAFAFGAEAVLLFVASVTAIGAGADLTRSAARLYVVILLTGIAMGARNAVVRKLAIPDLTTTVLTLTITGLGADFPLGGGDGSHWRRRLAAIGFMLAGAAVGAWLVARSIALPLPPSAAGAGATVFVMDDDLSVREALESLIRLAGWKVETLSSAQVSSIVATTALPAASCSTSVCRT